MKRMRWWGGPQLTSALGIVVVMVAGAASLGTTCMDAVRRVETSVALTFAADETEKILRIRLSSDGDLWQIRLESEPSLVFEVLAPSVSDAGFTTEQETLGYGELTLLCRDGIDCRDVMVAARPYEQIGAQTATVRVEGGAVTDCGGEGADRVELVVTDE